MAWNGNRIQIVDPTTFRPVQIESNGGMAVNLQDQTSRPIDIRAWATQANVITLAQTPVVNSYEIELEPGHGVIVGDSLSVVEQNGLEQWLFGSALAVNVNTITLDTPVPFPFTPSVAFGFVSEEQMNVDGSITPVIFGTLNSFDSAADITRIIWHITDNVSMDDAKFGGLARLARGCVLRKKMLDGNYINYSNIHTNGEMGELAYDKSYDDKAPSGVYGVTVRLTYAGASKHGVTLRLEQGEELQLVVQDDLTALTSYIMMVQGHFVTN